MCQRSLRSKAKMNIQSVTVALGITAICAISVEHVRAEDYPSKPVRLIVGFTAAGVTDFLARAIAPRLSDVLGTQFVVDNRPGASGMIANDLVAKAAPDGSTLLVASGSSITSNPHMRSKMPYDSLKDLAPITQIAVFSFVLVSHPGVPAKTVRELVALAKAKPGVLTFGSSGIGTAFHLSCELFNRTANVNIVHIPYKGGSAALIDILGGRVDLMFYSLATLQPYIESRKLRAIAVTSLVRSPQLPDVPTVDESGLRGFEMSGWQGMFAPGKTPESIVGRLNTSIVKVLTTPAIRELWKTQGLDVATNTPEQFAAIVKHEYDRYGKLIKAAGIKVEQ